MQRENLAGFQSSLAFQGQGYGGKDGRKKVLRCVYHLS